MCTDVLSCIINGGSPEASLSGLPKRPRLPTGWCKTLSIRRLIASYTSLSFSLVYESSSVSRASPIALDPAPSHTRTTRSGIFERAPLGVNRR